MSSAYAFCDPDLYASMTKRTLEDLKTFFNNPESYTALKAPRHIVRGVEVPSATALLDATSRERENKPLEFLYADELPDRSATYLKRGAVPFPVYVGQKDEKPYFRYAYWIDSLTETAMNGVKTWIRQGLDYNAVHPDRNLSMFETKSGSDGVVHDFFVRLGEISASTPSFKKEGSPKPLFSEISSILKEHVNILDASLKIGRTLSAFLALRYGSVTRNILTARDLIMAGSAMAVGASLVLGHLNVPDIHHIVPDVLNKLHLTLTHTPSTFSHPLNAPIHEIAPSPVTHSPHPNPTLEHKPPLVPPPHSEKISHPLPPPSPTHSVMGEEGFRKEFDKAISGIPTAWGGLSPLADSTFVQSENNIRLLQDGLRFLHTLHPDWVFVLPPDSGAGVYLGVIPSEDGTMSISLVRAGNAVILLHNAPEVNVPLGSMVEFQADSPLTTSITSVTAAPSKGFKL